MSTASPPPTSSTGFTPTACRTAPRGILATPALAIPATPSHSQATTRCVPHVSRPVPHCPMGPIARPTITRPQAPGRFVHFGHHHTPHASASNQLRAPLPSAQPPRPSSTQIQVQCFAALRLRPPHPLQHIRPPALLLLLLLLLHHYPFTVLPTKNPTSHCPAAAQGDPQLSDPPRSTCRNPPCASCLPYTPTQPLTP